MLDYTPQAVAQFQMELRLTSDKTESLTSSLLQHIESTICESTTGIATCSHLFSSTQTDVVDKMLKSIMTDGNPYVRFRIGLSTTTEESWLPWQEQQIVSYSAAIKGVGEGAGHTFSIFTADRIYSLDRSTKIMSRKGKISDMVQQIAQAAKLDCVVEPTKTNFSYVQVNQSDIEFIRERLLNRAINDKGRGQYLLYMKDNVLHFHSPDYQSSIRQMSYYDVPHLDMVQVDRSQQLIDRGIAGTCMIVYDPYVGQANEINSDAEKHLRMSDGIYLLENVDKGRQTLLYHLGTNQAEEASAIAQNVYSFSRGETFEISLNVLKSISIRLGDILQFVLAPQASKTSSWSGYYLVTHVTSLVKKDTLTTMYTIKRGEISKDQVNITQPNDASQLVPETTAPGQDINIATTQKSVLTVGAGKQNSATVYSTVADRNSAPGT